MKNSDATVIRRVADEYRNHVDLATERAVYAEIGRIVCTPFSVADVYESFARQVARIIPFDMIVITHTDPRRDLVMIKYAIGLDAMGMSEGDTIPLKDSVVSDVAAAKRAIRTDQFPYSGSLARSFAESGLLSRVATPLIANELVVGTLHLGSRESDVYGESELARLEIVGNLIAGAIAGEILLQVERDRAGQLESLYNVAAILAQSLTFEAKAQRIVDALVLIADADHVVLRRGDEEHENLTLVASAGSGLIEVQQTLRLTDGYFSTLQAYVEGKSILINDYGLDQDSTSNPLSKGLKSMCFMPIRSGNEILGSLSVSSMTANRFDENQIAMMTACSNELGPLFDVADQAAKLQKSQEAALERERRISTEKNALYRISRIFAEGGDFNVKATAALETLVDIANADWATLRLPKDDGPGLHLAAAAGNAVGKYPPKPVITADQEMSTKAFEEGKIIVTDDYAAWPDSAQSLVELEMQSLVFLPVNVGDRIIGLVTIISKNTSAFDQESVDILTILVEGLGALVEISILQDESEEAHRELERMTDALSRSNEEISQWNQFLEDSMTTRTVELEIARDLVLRSEKLAIIGQLSAGMAHDLRNPLSAIRNATYILKKELASKGAFDANEKLKHCIEIIDKQVNASSDCISDLMNFARLDEIRLAETRLDELLEQIKETMIKRDGISFLQTIESDVRPLMADGDLLQRVFLNLANNAQEAMPGGGCLTVAARMANDMLEVTFSDTGEGISEENLDRIFDPLFTTKIKGTGLGLAVCQGIIERHGGTIKARQNEEPSGGTTFEVRIPAIPTTGGETIYDA